MEIECVTDIFALPRGCVCSVLRHEFAVMVERKFSCYSIHNTDRTFGALVRCFFAFDFRWGLLWLQKTNYRTSRSHKSDPTTDS